MNRKLITVLIANLFAVGAAYAAEGDFTLSGSVSIGGRYTSDKGEADNGAKLHEYRDLESSAIGIIDLRGRGSQYYLDFFGENLGRDDQYLDLKGGKYGIFKYRLYNDELRHNFTWNARSPFSGIGSANLTSTLAQGNAFPGTYTPFDYGVDRRDWGGMFELSNNSPWHVRAEANEITMNGLKPVGLAGTGSPGGGFFEVPLPIDYKTRNVSLEGGYSSKRGHVTVNVSKSSFTNSNSLLTFSNRNYSPPSGPYTDETPLPPDNDQIKVSANGVLRQLPMGSTLAGRLTYSNLTNSVAVRSQYLSAANTYTTATITNPAFEGNIKTTTASLSLTSNPTRGLDTRIFWNWYDKNNDSTQLAYVIAPPVATVYNTLPINYKKNNLGAEGGYKVDGANKVSVGYEFSKTNLNRPDFDETKDNKVYVEWKNSSFDVVSGRIKYQYLQRRSNFLDYNAGTGPGDAAYLLRYTRAFDHANVNQHQVRLSLDSSPVELLDLGLELFGKKNDYKETTLGRTDDKRYEIYASAAYGDRDTFRVMVFGDYEWTRNDSYHRYINSSCAGNSCDPTLPPTATAYNWLGKLTQKSWAVGMGADWPVIEKLLVKASAIWSRTEGVVDFISQNNFGNPLPIPNYDNSRRLSLNLKGTYKLDKKWEFTGGYAFEKFRFSDLQVDGYRYKAAAADYLSGAYAFPNYTANMFYAYGTYKF